MQGGNLNDIKKEAPLFATAKDTTIPSATTATGKPGLVAKAPRIPEAQEVTTDAQTVKEDYS